MTIATGMGSSKTGIACAIKDPCQNKTYMPDRFTINGKRLSPVLNAIKSDPLALGKWASFLQRGLDKPGRKAFKRKAARRKAQGRKTYEKLTSLNNYLLVFYIQ